MAKFCIFCGKPPVDKNKEHVIPRWLIELTGDPKRVVRLGLKKETEGKPGFREYAFDQFTFPACEGCNTRHSELESVTKSTMIRIIEGKEITGTEISGLLDWFDKVRVGLWLAFHQLDKNLSGITPQFHIEKRIGQFDRLLIVEKDNSSKQRLNFSGADTFAFAYLPTAFTLMVNNYYFTNISSLYLFSRRLGFPYPDELFKDANSPQLKCNIMPARERVMSPVLQRFTRSDVIKLYQPMFGLNLHPEKIPHYDNEYVKRHCYDHALGIGAIFCELNNDDTKLIGVNDKITINPKAQYSFEEQTLLSVIDSYEWQNWLMNKPPNYAYLEPEHRKNIRSQHSVAKKFNDFFIDHHKRLLKKYRSLK